MADSMTKTKRDPDFTGWATKSGIRCTDGRTIAPGAFAHQDAVKVPLVWMHRSQEPDNVLGHAVLEDRAFGTYFQAWFNGSAKALHMKEAVQNEDIDSVSIFANRLAETKSHNGSYVTHGNIQELSLVIAGANEGAKIDFVNMIHSDGREEVFDDEADIQLGLSIRHGDSLGLDDDDDGSEDLDDEEINELMHYGVPGMKWGVRRDKRGQAVVGRNEKAGDEKLYKQPRGLTKKLQKAARNRANSDIIDLNSRGKFYKKNLNLTENKALKREYDKQVTEIVKKAFDEAPEQAEFDKKMLTRNALIVGGAVVLNYAAGAAIQAYQLKHAEDSTDSQEMRFPFTRDDNGLIALDAIGEDTMAHEDDGTTVVDTQDTDTDAEELDEDYVQSVFGTMTEEQRNVLLYTAGQAYELGQSESTGASTDASVQHSDSADAASVITSDGAAVDGTGILAHFNQESQKGSNMNVFDTTDKTAQKTEASLSHAQQFELITKARKAGGFQALFGKNEDNPGTMSHADVETTYGVDSIDLLFPDATLDGAPSVISRRTEWVNKVLTGVKKQPFAKIKSLTFDITASEARARGYIKGTKKKDEVVRLLKRTTGPTTVYKKQKLDRDDILDITDFDVVVWLKWEIRFMLDEEIARAILIGDGRSASNPDKIKDPEGEINGEGIRSIFHDHEMYAHPVRIANVVDETATEGTERKIEEITRSRSAYRGSGNPIFFTTDREITDMLLLKDKVGRRLYGTEAELAAVLRVREIVAVEVMEEAEGLLGLLVNLSDYTVGANKGGELTFFSDFDIDFNQEKFLMETRISGALNKPKSAIVLRFNRGTAVTAITAPTFLDNVISIPTVAGVIFTIDDEPVTGDVTIEEDTDVYAKPAADRYIQDGVTRRWSYTFTE